jgi:hypothetical protein
MFVVPGLFHRFAKAVTRMTWPVAV